jgi:hypothetical protein
MFRPSTSLVLQCREVVDARHKAGHDDSESVRASRKSGKPDFRKLSEPQVG